MQRQLPFVTVLLCAFQKDSRKFLIKHLSSIKKQNYPKNKLKIIIRDNGIEKNTRQKIKQISPAIRIIGNGKNVNFAKGINEASKYASGDYYFIVNPDTVIEKNCIRHLVGEIQKENEIAIAAPLVFSMDNKKSISRFDLPVSNLNLFTGRIINITPRELKLLKLPITVYWASGCAILIKSKIWEKLRGFNSRYIIYWEDADFGMRAREAGLKTVLVPKAFVWHKGSAVYGSNPQKVYFLVRNKLIFLNQHLNIFGKFLTHVQNTVVYLIKLLKILIGNDAEYDKAFLKGIVNYYLKRQ